MTYNNTNGRTAAASLELASTSKKRFEEFLRRQLGVSDATDPKAVVDALQKRYPSAAARLEEERQGGTIRFNAQPEAPVVVGRDEFGATAGSYRAGMVSAALTADLECVMSHLSNRVFRVALAGWRDAVLAEWAEGLDAAVLGADPTQRDRVFYSVRKLGDYARVARMIGLVNPDVSLDYRRLARTLDEAAMVLRVRVGEAYFRAGFSEGGSVFQIALSDLHQRREGLISALEQLNSSVVEDSHDWGDSEASYSALWRELEAKGQQDLRAIIVPEAMSRLLDVLLGHVEQQSQPELLQELAATAPIELVQLKRLEKVAAGLLTGPGSTASAPLSSFVSALHRFIEAFARPGANSRILDLAIPFPFAMEQSSRPDPEGRQTVRDLLLGRSEVARELEAQFADPDFDPLDLDQRIFVLLDRVLYDLDRAFDLYLLGSGTSTAPGVEERRAALYGISLDKWLTLPALRKSVSLPPSPLEQIRLSIIKLRDLLTTSIPPTENEKAQFRTEQQALENEWKALALQLSRPNARRQELLNLSGLLYSENVLGGAAPSLGCDTIDVIPDSRISDHRIATVLEELAHRNEDRKPPARSRDLPSQPPEHRAGGDNGSASNARQGPKKARTHSKKQSGQERRHSSKNSADSSIPKH
ncbi:hypothetical protein P2318_32155 [Myxococcaceae bacterium GXIMD 01537]